MTAAHPRRPPHRGHPARHHGGRRPPCLGPWILGGFLVLAPAALAGDDEPSSEARQPVLETPWFAFFSDFDFNLYDAVLASATARRRERPESLHGECFAALVQEERSAWDATVAYYSETVAATGDFSRERFIVRSRLAELGAELDDDDRRDLTLSLLFLRAAAPAYRACGWPEQDAANRRWIAELAGRLERHAEAIRQRLETFYGGGWRSLPITVDVVGTAGWAGADTIADRNIPTHVQITSRAPGYQGAAALEMIFHEASHEIVGPWNGPVAELLRAAAAEAGVELDRNLWHGLLFVSAGEVTRAVLEAAGETGYVPFAEAHGVFQALHEPLRTHWLPYLRGETGREEAARALVEAAAPPP